VTIRPAELRDVEGIVKVWFDSAEHHAALEPDRYYLPDRAAILERYRSGGQYPEGISEKTTLVAEGESGVIGFADAWIGSTFDPMLQPMRYCFIADLAVARLERSGGVGEQLMRAVEAWGKDNGARFVVLEASVRNTRAIGFYERIGYEAVNTSMIRWIS
jgi:ribosomal protein S18 acetylase RimI-like enzyme